MVRQNSDLEKHTIDEALYGLKESLEANIDAKFKFSKKYLTGEYLEDQDSINHHIGTLKMASSSNEGMVDKDLKLFGLNNLYVLVVPYFLHLQMLILL